MSKFPKTKYRQRLPQLDGGLFLADGGIETTLIFHEGWDLPMNAAFVLLESERGRAALRAYFDRYAPMAVRQGFGFVLESPTWRANPDWAAKIGRDRAELAKANRDAIDLMIEIRDQYETKRSPFVISGCIGPRGDGYDPGKVMSAEEAEDYHGWQVGIFRETSADFVSAITMTNVPEATGVARAAKVARMPCVISFTLETDGRLPTGEALGEAILAVDAATDSYPGLLHDQLRPPDALRARARSGRAVDRTAPWPARERVQAQPHRARQRAGDRHREPRGAGSPVRRPRRSPTADQRARRVLRHRSPPRRLHRPRLQGRGVGAPFVPPVAAGIFLPAVLRKLSAVFGALGAAAANLERHRPRREPRLLGPGR